MQLIAIRNFRNPGRALEIEEPVAPDHVHKGAIFEIGGKAPFDKLNRTDKELVVQLNAAQCIADATDEKIVKAVRAELEEESKAAKAKAAAATAKGK